MLPLPLSLCLCARPVLVVALAVVTSPNPICSLAAITFGSHPHPAAHRLGSLPTSSPLGTLHSSYFDRGPRQPWTGVTCGIKYFEEGRSTHSALDLYALALALALCLRLDRLLWAACVTPRTREAVHQPIVLHTRLVCTLALGERERERDGVSPLPVAYAGRG